MSGTLTRVTTSEATLPPSSPAERSEGKGIQGPHRSLKDLGSLPLLDPLPSASKHRANARCVRVAALSLAGGDGLGISERARP